MRFFFLLLLSLALQANIDQKITLSKNKLNQTKSSLKRLNLKLYTTARDIQKEERQLKNIENSLNSLEKEIDDKEKNYQENIKKLEDLNETKVNLTKSSKKLKEELTLLIAQYFSKSIVASKIEKANLEDVINEEILDAIKKSQKGKILEVSKKYTSVEKELEKIKSQIAKLKNEIRDLENRKKKLVKFKKREKDTLLTLKNRKIKYKNTINNLLKEQKSLRDAVAKLKILKYKQGVKAYKANNIKIKKYGHSYQYVKTIRYRGPKTIPPLDRFVITKRYGKYIDPIYKIKIFNESIELKPLETNEKVKNVLDGRVVLVKKTPNLNYVVILKHKNSLYTIYANIDKVSPIVKKGKRLKRGYVIGRVSRKLTFEVTKNSYHINPLDLIRVN